MTQKERILRHLRDCGSISQLEALKEYGIMRPSSRVSELRAEGYPIRREMVTVKNRYNENTSYARYFMDE